VTLVEPRSSKAHDRTHIYPLRRRELLLRCRFTGQTTTEHEPDSSLLAALSGSLREPTLWVRLFPTLRFGDSLPRRIRTRPTTSLLICSVPIRMPWTSDLASHDAIPGSGAAMSGVARLGIGPVIVLQAFHQGLGCRVGIVLEPNEDLRPDFLKGVLAGSPGARRRGRIAVSRTDSPSRQSSGVWQGILQGSADPGRDSVAELSAARVDWPSRI